VIQGRNTRRAGAMLAVGLCVALAAGCSGSSSSGSGAKGSTKNVSLTMYTGATGQLANNFNPYSPTTNIAAQGMIYEPLMFFNLGRAGESEPLLATQYTWSADGKTLKFTIRSGAKWTDGQPLTATDVAFTFNLLKKYKALNVNGVPYDTVTADDPTHVTLTFTEPAFTDLWYIAGQTWIVPEHTWSKVSDPTTFTDPKPVGSGPFTLNTFSPQNFTMKKNPNYWQPGKPQVSALRFISLSGNTSALTALQSGQVDWQSAFIPKLQQVWGSKAPTNNWINTPLFQTELTANMDKFPTNDKAVRQALYYGVDRTQLNSIAFDNQASDTNCALALQPRDNSWVDQSIPNLKTTYDPAKAQQLLQADGWAKGSDGIYAKGGKRLSVTIKVITGYSDYISALQAMQQQYKKVGIEVKPQQVSYASFTNDRNMGNYDLVMDSVYGGPTPYYLYQSFFNSANTAPIGKTANPNYARYRNPTVDQALATIAGTNDQATQKTAYATLQKQICNDMPYIPLIQNSTLTEFRTDKVTGFPTKDNLYAIPAVYERPDVAIIAANLKVK
jgi:peptide/nickel transport system substrate-binding protein